MTTRIDCLDIRLSGDRARAAAFARALRHELAGARIDAAALRLDRLDLPPVTARPGEPVARLAARTAAAIVAAVNARGRTP